MSDSKIKITAVNYLNTFPFKYALEKFANQVDWAEINYAAPAECAQMLINNETNLALAPIAVLAKQPNLNIVTNFCLSTFNEVKSVKLYSKKSIEDIQTIVLDYQSLSSVSLIKVLMKYYWKKSVRYLQGYKGFENKLSADAMVVIGDRTFELNGKFPYEYDLATEWYRYYGKPFVFAGWISNVILKDSYLQQLNTIFDYGLQHLDEVIDYAMQNHSLSGKRLNKEIIADYLTNKMHYRLTNDRKESIEHFLHLLKKLETEKSVVDF
ncbi:MAG: chorismate dehydratase [Bacteroidia bacterium]|nr:MAG: chorismate dehydratase [Bacteroidia bacterium]